MKRLHYILAALLLIVAASCTSKDKTANKPPQSLEELKGSKIAVVSGSVQDIALSEMGMGDNLARMKSETDMMAALSNDAVDYMFMDSSATIGAHLDKKGIVPLFKSEPNGPYAFGFKKDKGALCKEIDAYLQKIRNNGEYDKLYDRWISKNAENNGLRTFDYSKAAKTITVGITTMYPFTFIKDGKWSGFEIEFLESFAQDCGYNVKFLNMDFDGIIPALVSGRIDMASAQMTITEERKKSIIFSQPYYITYSCCFAKQARFKSMAAAEADDIQKRPTDVKQLKDSKIAVVAGSIQDIELSKMGMSDDLVRLGSTADLITSIVSGTSDYMFIDSSAVIGARMDEKGVIPLFSSEPLGPYGFGLRKDEKELCLQINAFIKESKDNGAYDKLYDRWFKGNPENNELHRFSYSKNAKKLDVGLCPMFPFMFMKNNEWSGFEAELLGYFAEKYGYRLEFHSADFAGLMPALVSGKINIVASQMTITEERKKSIDFTDPYYTTYSCCFAKESRFSSAAANTAGDSTGFLQSVKNSFVNNFIVEDRWKLAFKGLWETIVISFWSIIFGALLGGVVCALMFSRSKAIRKTTNAFCTFICGIPILVLLMVMFYIIFASTPLSGRVVAIIAFAINFACSISGVYYSGIKSIDYGQTEAGLALGFTPVQTFINFILPQASKRILPLFKGEASSLIKNTSVVGYIAIQDLTKVCDIIRSRTFDAFFPLIAISIVYFLLAWLFGVIIDSLGKRLK